MLHTYAALSAVHIFSRVFLQLLFSFNYWEIQCACSWSSDMTDSDVVTKRKLIALTENRNPVIQHIADQTNVYIYTFLRSNLWFFKTGNDRRVKSVVASIPQI
jgi:hypothetical protein